MVAGQAVSVPAVRPQVTVPGLLARFSVLLAVVVAVIAVPLSLGPTQEQEATLAAIYAVIGLSMNILVGYAGQISLGQQAFVGVGALVAANVANTGIDPADPFTFGISLVVATAIGAGTALLLGAVALRIQGLYLALVTL